MTEQLQNLTKALAEILPTLEGAKKNSTNPHFKSKYADLASTIEAIRPAAEKGVWFRQALRECEGGVQVETFYIGFGAELSAGTLVMPADRNNAQGYGSALTYARRYALQTAFGLAPEDDDGNAASAPASAKNLSANQVSELQEIIAKAQASQQDILNHYGVKALAFLTNTQHETLKGILNKKIKGLDDDRTN